MVCYHTTGKVLPVFLLIWFAEFSTVSGQFEVSRYRERDLVNWRTDIRGQVENNNWNRLNEKGSTDGYRTEFGPDSMRGIRSPWRGGRRWNNRWDRRRDGERRSRNGQDRTQGRQMNDQPSRSFSDTETGRPRTSNRARDTDVDIEFNVNNVDSGFNILNTVGIENARNPINVGDSVNSNGFSERRRGK